MGESHLFNGLALFFLIVFYHFTEGAQPPPFKLLEFTTEPTDTVVKSGDEALLSCSAKYDGTCETCVYLWKRNNVVLSSWPAGSPRTRYTLSNGSLYFNSVESTTVDIYPAQYRCIAEEMEGTIVHRISTPEITLSIAESPKIISQPRDLILYSGETAMFRCHAEGPPKVTYAWSRNGVKLLSSSRLLLHSDGEVLEIRSVNQSDTGQYRCKAQNIVTEVLSAYASLSVLSRAEANASATTVLMDTDAESYDEGENNSTSLISNFWEILGFGYKKVETTIPPVQLESTRTTFPMELIANYTEQISSTVKTELASPNYMSPNSPTSPRPLHKPPNLRITTSHDVGSDFVMKPWDTSAIQGSTVILFCSVNGTDSNGNIPTVTWLKGGSTVNTSSGGKFSIIGSGSLQISNVSLADDGVYTCRGANLEEMSDAEATLSVKVAPYFRSVPQSTYGRVNEDIILNCDIGGTPAPEVTWFKGSEKVASSQYFKFIGHSLKISWLMPSDSGYFQCMGRNEVGKIQGVAQLIILDADTSVSDVEIRSYTSAVPTQTLLPVDSSRPAAPSNLRTVIVSQTYVTLTWGVAARPGVAPVTTYTVTTKQIGDSRMRVINTTSADCTVEGLLPNTQYLFTVASYNKHGRSLRTTELTAATEAEVAVPETVVSMRAWATSHESIFVTWDPPAVTNGPISNYKVFFYSQNQSRELYKQVRTTTTVSIDDLHPYTEYYIRVVANNQNGPGTPTEEKTVRTFSAKPSAAPNATLEVVGTSVITVRWAPPPSESLNGLITGYKIRYKQKDSSGRATPHTTDADARSYDITELTAGITYVVRISAININGSGDYSPWKEVTTFAVELDETRPPGKPSFIQLKPFAKEMIVSWGMPEDSRDILVRGFRLGYGIDFPDDKWIRNIAPSTRIHSLYNLEPLKNYVVQVVAYNNAGSSPSAEQQAFTLEAFAGPTDSELTLPMEVKVRIISATSAMVSWHDSTLGQNQRQLDDRVYTVKYNALSGSAQRKTLFRNTTDPFLRVDGLLPYTKYEFRVMITKGNRVSVFSLSARNQTFEDTPSSPPRDLTVTLLENKPTMLMVSWQPPSNANGRIVSYTIYSNTNYDLPLDDWIVESVPGHLLNHEFGPVTPSTVYFFRIAAHNSKGASPPSPTKALKTLDGTFLVNPGGELPNPGSGGSELNPPPVRTPDQVTGAANPSPLNAGVTSAQTLWIIIACVSAVTALAIAALIAVLCRRRILNDRRKPANLKASNQAPKGMNKGGKQQSPDLWIDHEQVELKAMDKVVDPHGVIDEQTSMLQSHSQYDVTSASMMGDGYLDEPRYSTLGRQRPIINAPQQIRDAMPRAAVQPMNVDRNHRPVYPRTQFAAHHYGSTPRVHVGDTSQPTMETSSFCTDPVTGLTGVVTPVPHGFTNGELESYNHINSTQYTKPYMINGEELPPPRPPPMEGRPYPLRSFNNTNGTGHNIPKHIVKPQPISVFKPSPTPSEEMITDSDPIKKPPRPPYANRQNSQNSLSRSHLKLSLKNGSTEHLTSEMAHLDNIMQDLNSMKNDFGYAA